MFLDMLISLISILLLVWAGYLIQNPLHQGDKKYIFLTRMLQIPLICIGSLLFISPSFVMVDDNEIGYLKPRFLSSDLRVKGIIHGDIIRANGAKTDLIEPGIHFMPYVRILNEVLTSPIVEIKDGYYGIISTIDGFPYAEQFPEEWNPNKIQDMLNAKYFLTQGKGKKGTQLTILPPGKYPIHPALYYVEVEKALDVPIHHVAIVRSHAQTNKDCIEQPNTLDPRLPIRHVTVVPVGCIGIWEEPLPAGQHYINKLAYKTTIIPVGMQTLTFSGKNSKELIPIKAADKNTIPKYSAGPALSVRIFRYERDGVLFNVSVDVETNPNEAVSRFKYFSILSNGYYSIKTANTLANSIERFLQPIILSNKTSHYINNPKKIEAMLLKALKKEPPPYYIFHDVRIDKIISTPEHLNTLLHNK